MKHSSLGFSGLSTSREPETVLDSFTQNVRLYSSNPAIYLDSGSTLSFADLDQLSNQLAHLLKRKIGNRSKSRVGIMLPTDEWLIVSVLSVLKLGWAFVPMDRNHPKSRIIQIIKDAEIELVITSELLDDSSVLQILKADMQSEMLSYPTGRPEWQSKPNGDALAYILYTSGSTGVPKGCQIIHRSLFNYISACKETYFENGGGHFALYTTLTFDFTLTSLFFPLVHGTSIHLCPLGVEVDKMLVHIFGNKLVDTIKITPSHIDVLEMIDLKFTHISTVIVGGEALQNRNVETLKALNKKIHIYNEYGPTEATIGCLVERVDNSLYNEIGIGMPLKGVEAFIIGQNHEVLNYGEIGEICLAGDCLSIGYTGSNPSAGSFMDHFRDPLLRMYCTGDLGKQRQDGSFIYLGRIDDQVKIRGHRVELGEVENCLSSHPGIQQCVVLGIEENNAITKLGAFVQLKNNAAEADLTSFLRDRLPSYMIPACYHQVEEFPLTPNGKIDKKCLVHRLTESDNNGFKSPVSDNMEEEPQENLIGLLEKVGSIASSRVAYVSKDVTWSYEDLYKKTSQIANLLNNIYDIEPCQTVGVLLDKLDDLVLAILSLVRLNCTIVPIIHSSSDNQIEKILEEFSLDSMIIYESYLHKFEGLTIKVVAFDFLEYLDTESFNPNNVKSACDDLVYIYPGSDLKAGSQVSQMDQSTLIQYCSIWQKQLFFNKTGLHISIEEQSLSETFVKKLFICLLGGHTIFINLLEEEVSQEDLFRFYTTNRIDASDKVSDGLYHHMWELGADIIKAEESYETEIKLQNSHDIIEFKVVKIKDTESLLHGYFLRPLVDHSFNLSLKDKVTYRKTRLRSFFIDVPVSHLKTVDDQTKASLLSNEVEIVPPNTDTEKVVMSIWCQVLGDKCVSIKQDFFDLGGHSINAIQIGSRLNDHFDIELGVGDIFDNSSVEQLSNYIDLILWAI